MKTKGSAYVARYAAGIGKLNNLQSLWKTLLFYFLPNSEHLIWNRETDKGEYECPADDSGVKAASIMASGIYSYTVSRGQRVADLSIADMELNKDDDVQEYLSKKITLATQLIHSSNYTTAMYDLLRYYSVIGTDMLYSYYDRGLEKINFRTYRVFNTWLEANSSGRITTVIRSEMVPHTVAEERWKKDKLPEEVQKELDDPESSINDAEYLHVVEPNPNYIPSEGATEANARKARLSKHFKYRELWIHKDSETVVSEGGGYRTFPYHIARSGVQVDSLPYGRSQAMDALPTMRELHRSAQWMSDASELQARPPMIFPKGSMDPDDWDSRPDARNVTNPVDGFLPQLMQTSLSLEPMAQWIMNKRMVIDEYFFVPQFRALDQISGSNPTATEVQEAAKQGIQGIAPIIGTLEPEVFTTIVERVLDIMDLEGMGPEKPEIMEGKNIITHVTTQLDAELQSSDVRRTLLTLGQCFEIIKQYNENPEMNTIVDRDKIIRNTLYVNNVDPDAIFSSSEAEELQMKLAEANEQQQLMSEALAKVGQIDPMRAPEDGSMAAESILGGGGMIGE